MLGHSEIYAAVIIVQHTLTHIHVSMYMHTCVKIHGLKFTCEQNVFFCMERFMFIVLMAKT